MKVLVLGMPRTGTQSLADALALLGIAPVYHMREVGKNHHQRLWIEALEAKFEGKGEPWNREKFDQILGGYEALSDHPASIFSRELLAAYPEAAVILTLRPEDQWMASMTATLWHAHTHRPVSSPSPMAPLSIKINGLLWDDDFPAKGRGYYRAHNERVREAARGKRFLEYRPGDGWAPLCEFLGLEVPEGPYPRSDDWVEYKREVAEKERTGSGA
ncbi:P-loop containing nucleoside triphosphate hydrolase protein [Xylariaceae sp. FL0662B]|nr:P-loop containing nucleoside triphosphate hydrolase protein [Xylariaceae sp. FL0662B]